MFRPWDFALVDLHRQIDEVFEELIYRPWDIPGRAAWRPPLDLHETSDAYLVEVDLPGVAPDQVRVVVGERELAITAQRQATVPDAILSQQCERPCGTMQRVLRLPRAVDPQQARAEYRHGTCRVYLPKQRQPEGQGQQKTVGQGDARVVIQVAIL